PDEKKGETAKVASEALVRNWERLRGWIDGDRKFLFWRQKLQVSIAEWESHKRDPNALLFGVSLKETEYWMEERRNDLNGIEQQFIGESIRQRRERRRRWWTAAAAAFSMLVLILSAYLLAKNREGILILLRIWPERVPTPWVDEFLRESDKPAGKN